MAIGYHRDDDGIVTLTLDRPDRPVNTLDAVFGTALAAALDRLESEREHVTGVIVASAKTTFAVGADLDQIYSLTPADAPGFAEQLGRTKDAFRRLERLGRPVVAVIGGSALGGGLELALACHHRLCADDPAIRLGLPEVTLGLLPGGGGVVRTVRLLGPAAALPLLMEGERLPPRRALDAGLVDRLVPARELIGEARAWIAAHPDAKQPWDDPAPAAPPRFFEIAAARLYARTHGTLPAHERILACAAEAVRVDVDTALRTETRHLVALATGQVAKNMIGCHWYGRNEVTRRARSTGGVRRLGVIGAGMMGAGIAAVAAAAGIEVVLTDVNEEATERGHDEVVRRLRRQVAQGRMSAAACGTAVDHLAAPGSAIAGCDLVVEAVFEDRALKRRVLAAAEDGAAVLASNTSTLPITGLAEGLRAPGDLVGLHFISPVERVPLLEVVRGERTGDAALALAFAFARQIGKTPILVNDGPGFYTSRVFVSYTAEGAAMLAEGVPAALVENAARKAGMAVGPLAVSDEVALATMLRVRRQNEADAAADGRELGHTTAYGVFTWMVEEMNRPGRAGGGGFYDYPDRAGKRLWPGLAERFGGDRPIPERDVRERLLFAQALESVRALEDGVLTSSADANVGSVLGLAFAPWSGGTLQFVNQYGLRAFTERADRLADVYGEHLRPPTLLRGRTVPF
ncbi:3-hydroxyacyl-CoA dehydrogenase NAD-binding domain-containing protein [Nonomuraea endophytica]|uniref:3-hydroxyacyl-CoA dehydrogenase/enoyl-CoA hydratase/3-hydroxybutyryl-CoA epimerase n=1 Tax=Nonomuraea endophytica TaxID=714136 RepID=A0A7W8EKP7_9ACTN|nr:3-hydroxyacyl-CoA dehydrogenase NAD-binding domain-containing protein [Nonomuraea endophytica]MBB5082062.1 3-hydroxyacyl-CoA dehydrogenase/enoyl-CoA hydratase/3-hydroxybutyryl-CoA epimerase [Nonomuraea endophytica]